MKKLGLCLFLLFSFSCTKQAAPSPSYQYPRRFSSHAFVPRPPSQEKHPKGCGKLPGQIPRWDEISSTVPST